VGRRGPGSRKISLRAKKEKSYPGEYSKPPRRMTRPAKAHWRSIVGDFPPGYHQQKHFPLLEIFCESFAMWCKARTQLAGESLTVENERTGACKKNPLLNIIDCEVQKMNQLSAKLSLVVPVTRLGGDTSFSPTKKPPPTDTQLKTAYSKLKAREGTLEGAELTLFGKLELEYGEK